MHSWPKSSPMRCAQIWPKRQTVSFLAQEEDEEWQAPLGVITVEVLEARLPQRLAHTKKEKALNPYAAVVVGHSQVPVRCGAMAAP